MLLAGDEIGNTQSGNNNAYAQDNEIGWIGWDAPDMALADAVAALVAFRRAHPILRQKRFLHARERAADGLPDLFWWREDGAEMTAADWEDGGRRLLCVEKRTAAGTPAYAALETALFLVFNAGAAAEVVLPACPQGRRWVCRIDTGAPAPAVARPAAGRVACPAEAVLAFVQEPAP
jgi:glycogen operon protein